MKATKQATTQGRKRSAERQPGTASTKVGSRRPGAQDAKPSPRHVEAEPRPAKADGLGSPERARAPRVTNGAGASPSRRTRAARPSGAESTRRRAGAAKKVAAHDGAATKVAAHDGAATKVAAHDDAVKKIAAHDGAAKNPATLHEGVAKKVATNDNAKTAPAETPRANVTPVLTGVARAPHPEAFGAAYEGPPSVDSSASAPASLAPLPHSPRRRTLAGAFALPARLLRGVGKSVGLVREAYDKRAGVTLREGVLALGRLSQRLVGRKA